MPIRADNPIRKSHEDDLGWDIQAKRFSNAIRQLDASEGLVVGVFGTWGSGKTSFINLVREHLASSGGYKIIDFNPWMFSKAQDLVLAMCTQLSSSLSGNKKDLAKNILKYGLTIAEILSPRFAPLTGTIRKNAKRSLSQLRRDISTALKRGPNDPTIVVVVDDLDRLEIDDVRQVFKCIRLTAAFPNVIYIVACDRYRTAVALNDSLAASGSSWGHDYLDKIFQITFNIPVVDSAELEKQAKRALDDVWDRVPGKTRNGKFMNTAEIDILMPLVNNMRDVRRFANAVLTRALTIPDGIRKDYLIALESIRVFLPDSYVALCAAVDGLTQIPGSDYEKDILGSQVRAILDKAGKEREVIASLINIFFPEGTVCISDDSHFEQCTQGGLPFSMLPREDRYGPWPDDDADRRQILDQYLGKCPVNEQS